MKLDRLTREQGPAITQSFGYDGAGNRTLDGAGSYVYAPNSNRQTSRPQGPVTLDAAGHTTAQAGFTYTWDGPGRLKTVCLSGQLLATYHYDARHRRTRKETTAAAPQGAATVLYTYDGNDHLLAETDASGPIRSYVWRDDTPVAQIAHRPTRQVLYLETDHLGTPRAARNEAGTLVWRWEADAFGSTLPDEDPDGDGQPTVVNLRYPGQVFDPESGLHYNQARYYDPTSGRYLSPDPIGLAGGINTYAYVGSNPLAFVDPMGLAACFVDFPDYPITIPGTKIQTTLTPGHAGVFGYDESTGQTRYYEYGRYDSDFGSVERRRLPNLEIQPDGTPTPESWKKLIDALNKIGKDTDAELSCDKSADETKVYEYSERVKNDTNRPPYSWNPFRSNTCRDFARRAFEAGSGN